MSKLLRSLSFFLVLAGLPLIVAAAGLPVVDLYKNASCSCCGAWEKHMQAAGFRVRVHLSEDINATRARMGMPADYASCHTARIGDYLLEGHVPASDVRRLLVERPRAIGLAVPGMPLGAPGMEAPRAQGYDTLLVLPKGSRVFQRHPVK
ncbi:MAG: DUF411 domain-containing protein [Zoogloeaceae bacterium]|jgi:hypothetical protein|nr:DUF411 domain-containing protein [Zoogloeaceae bacterium]